MKKRVSLHKQILIMLFLSYAAIFSLLGVLYGYLRIDYENTIVNSYNALLAQTCIELENSLDAININAYEIYTHNSNFNNLTTEEGIECLADIYELSDYMENMALYNTRSHGYLVYYSNGENRTYRFNDDLFKNKDIEELKEVTKSLVQLDTSFKNWIYLNVNDRDYAILICRKNNVAICEIYCLSVLEDAFKAQFGDDIALYFENDDRTINGNSYEECDIYSQNISGTDLAICLAIPKKVFNFINPQQIVVLCITFVAAIFALIFYRKLKQELLYPLSKMETELKRIAGGDMDRHIMSSSNFDELQTVIDTVNKTLDEVETQKYNAYEQSLETQKALSQYLSMQLKPHFYLNGLKTLNVLAMNGENKKIQDIIMRLSEHLRYLLSAEKPFVELTAEINYVNNYLGLQREMTDRPIEINWQLDENIRNWIVPNLCIQTFVENSIKYAKLKGATNTLIINVAINELETEDGLFLDICVMDNGEGYSEDVLKVINGDAIEGSFCIGINNLKRRCKILYDNWSDYYFMNDGGAVSDIIVPWKEQL